jgi:hypothetical protein
LLHRNGLVRCRGVQYFITPFPPPPVRPNGCFTSTRQKQIPSNQPVYSSELLLGADRHIYEFYNHRPQGAGSNLAFNTSALFRQGRSWYAVMVLSDKFVILNISDEEFAVKGEPGCHIKPLGKSGRPGDPAAWFDKLKSYASGIKTKWGPKPQCETPQDLKDANQESGGGDRGGKVTLHSTKADMSVSALPKPPSSNCRTASRRRSFRVRTSRSVCWKSRVVAK